MTDKTAIELIYEMHEMLQKMDTRLAMLELNVNLINDKANGKLFETVNKEMPKGKQVVPKKKVPGTIGPDRLDPTFQSFEEPLPERPQSIRVFGSFLDIRRKPIGGIEVTVLNSNNTVVKQTRTNRAGQFVSFLPPGKYSMEFIKEGMAPQFKTFEVREGQQELEVL